MDELFEILRIPDASLRRRAVSAMSRLPDDDDELAAFVMAALGDPDYGVRKEVVLRLPQLALPARLLPVLESALRDDELARRSSAIELLARIGAAALPTLVRLLDDPSDGVRRIVVDTLGLIGTKAAARPLLDATRDRNPAVRAAALESVMRCDPELGREVLVTALRKDDVASVRMSVLLALERAGEVLPAELLRGLVDDAFTAAPALRLLGRSGDHGAVLAALGAARGSRLRAALHGLVEVAARDPLVVRAAVRARTLPLDVIEGIIATSEPPALAGALYVGALHARARWFSHALARRDRAAAHAEALRVAALLGGTSLADELRAEAIHVDHDVGAALREIADAVPAAPRRAPSSPVEPTLAPATFKSLAAIFERSAGLAVEAHTAYRVESRLRPRLAACGVATFEHYVDLLRAPDGRAELELALSLVTVHETYFYREAHQLDVFRKDVLPVLARRRDGASARPFTVWSAGCSTGEEAWSLAMVLDDSRAIDHGRYLVVGSDLAPDVIAAARAGRYGRRSMRGDLGPALRGRYLDDEGDGVVVGPRVRDRVRFEVHNLVAAPPPVTPCDAVFCRNVLIYLTPDARNRLIATFYEHLVPGGALFLGHSESLLNAETAFRFQPVQRELVYFRPLDDGSAPYP